MEIKWTIWEGMRCLRMSDAELEVEFLPEYGGQVRSLVHRPSGLSLLRTPKTREELTGRPFLFGIPVLFLPGRLRGGAFELGGRRYQWPKNERGENHLHGFVWGRPWTLTPDADGAPAVTAVFDAHPATAEAQAFGHPFRLTITYRIEGASLTLRAVVENRGADPMPVGIGYHTTFNLTDTTGAPISYVAHMPPGLEWEMLPDLMPSGPLREPEKFAKWVRGGQPIWEFVSDNLFLVDEHAHNEIRLVADDPDITLWMTADPPVRNWVVYRPALDAPFVSLEPVSWVHDAPNLPEPVERTGARLLPPGDRAEFRYTLGIRTGT